jgi:very-short-patch-repair endonuclease
VTHDRWGTEFSLSLEGRGLGVRVETGNSTNQTPTTPHDQRDPTSFARALRKSSTDAERLLWSRLRAGRCEGLKFRRQQPIGRYIVDFVCLERRLVVELDGGQHALPEDRRKDCERDAWLEKEGYTVLRFWNNEVLANTDGVLEVIRKKLTE